MKYLVFHRESNNFDDIIKEVKQYKIGFRTKFSKHLIIGFTEPFEHIQSLFILKYGDDLISFNNLCPDRSPIVDKDYTPIKTPSKFRRTFSS
jgi:hypothetical protein